MRPLAVAAVLIFSKRPEKLAAFYRQTFGLPLRRIEFAEDEVHWACEVGRVYVAIATASRRRRTGPGAAIAFMVEDVVAASRSLAAAGLRFDFGPRRTPVGLIARLRDPEGNPVELYQP